MQFRRTDSLLFFIPILLFGVSLNAQNTLKIDWTKQIGYSFKEYGNDIIQAFDGGIVVIGTTELASNAHSDVFIIKSDSKISQFETYAHGTRDNEFGLGIHQTRNGNLAVVGYSESNIDDNKNKDGLFLLLDHSGQKVIRDTLLGTGMDDVWYDIIEDSKGNLVLVGESDGKVWVTKMDLYGNVLWEEKFSQNGKATAMAALYSKEGSIIIVGGSKTKKNDNMLFLRLSHDGQLLENKTIGLGQANAIIENDDGTIIIGGHREGQRRRNNGVIIKCTNRGDILFEQEYGGNGEDGFNGLVRGLEGELYAVGYNSSYKRGVSRNKGWLCKIGQNSVLLAEGVPGGKYSDSITNIIQLDDTRLVLTGHTSSNAKWRDAWVLGVNSKNLPIYTETPNISHSEPMFIENNMNGILDPGEHGYITFEVTNTSSMDTYKIIAEVNPVNTTAKGLNWIPELHIGHLKAGRTKTISIPFWSNMDVETGTSNFQITFEEHNGATVKPIEVQIKSSKEKIAELEVVAHKFNTKRNEFYRDKEMSLSLTIKNTGELQSSRSNLQISLPEQVKNITNLIHEIPSLKAGEECQVIFEFIPDAIFQEMEIKVKVWLDTSSNNHKNKRYTFRQKLEDEIEPRQPPEIPKEQEFTSITWIRPNNVSEGSTITIYTEQINLECFAFSSKPLREEQFSVFINDRPSKKRGEKLERVKLNSLDNRETLGTTKKFKIKLSLDIELEEGMNFIYVHVKNEAGEDRTSSLKMNYQPHQPNLHVISIGVPYSNLQYPSKDAKDFVKAMKNQEKKIFNKVYTYLYNTEEQTKFSGLRKVFRDLKLSFDLNEIKPIDLVIVFISSHGIDIEDQNQRKLYIPASNFSDLQPDLYSLDFEYDILEQLNALACSKLILLDACKSGTAIRGEKSIGLPSDLAGVIEEIINADNSVRTIVSCKATESSWEDSGWENGAFTEAILEALGNKEVEVGNRERIIADQNNDKILSLGELFDYVKKRVPFLVEKAKKADQNPTMSNQQYEENLKLFYLGR